MIKATSGRPPGIHRERHTTRNSFVVPTAVLFLLVAAVAMIVVPNLHTGSATTRSAHDAAESAVDPRLLVPQIADLPQGTALSSYSYVTTQQAAQRNDTPLSLLRQFGREIGYTRDFQVPHYGDIEVDVVRYRTRDGLARAYAYFLALPARLGTRPIHFRGLGQDAALVVTPSGGFVEFVRGRYYAVVTAVPITGDSLKLIGQLSKQVDRRILTYRTST